MSRLFLILLTLLVAVSPAISSVPQTCANAQDCPFFTPPKIEPPKHDCCIDREKSPDSKHADHHTPMLRCCCDQLNWIAPAFEPINTAGELVATLHFDQGNPATLFFAPPTPPPRIN